MSSILKVLGMHFLKPCKFLFTWKTECFENNLSKTRAFAQNIKLESSVSELEILQLLDKTSSFYTSQMN